MGFLSILLWVVTNLPSILSLVRQIIGLIGNLPHSQRGQAVASLQAAYQVAKDTGNTKPLNDLHDQLCGGGVACPPHLVGNEN